MATFDTVAPELRRAETEIDHAHLGNKLLSRPFGEAAWHYLAACEGRFIAPIIADSIPLLQDKQAIAALGDSIMTQAKLLAAAQNYTEVAGENVTLGGPVVRAARRRV